VNPPATAADALVPARHARSTLLARPAARRVAEALGAAPSAMTAREVADALGLHHSAVRPQLAALERAGVAASATDPPRGRGRPVRRWRLAPDPDAPEADGHRELVRLLMSLMRQTGLGPEEMESFGERQGRAIPVPGGGPDELRDAFARLGFAPREEPGALLLDRCPFAHGVEAPGGDLICVLHRGLARGIAHTAAPGLVVRDLVPQDPRKAGCRLIVEEEES
jgi:predicted ArsR family transcriptional regulator